MNGRSEKCEKMDEEKQQIHMYFRLTAQSPDDRRVYTFAEFDALNVRQDTREGAYTRMFFHFISIKRFFSNLFSYMMIESANAVTRHFKSLLPTFEFHTGIWVKAMTCELAWRSAAILHHIDRKYALDELICHHGGKNSFCIDDSKFDLQQIFSMMYSRIVSI